MKLLFAVLLTVWLYNACTQAGPKSATDSDGITMYGTIDEGVTFRK